VEDKTVVEVPYSIDWSMPQYSLAGEVEVTEMYVIEPVNLLLSVPPQLISPFKSLPVMEGSKEIPIECAEMIPCENKLSVTVGMLLLEAGDKVPTVRSTGPMPRIPSTPVKPDEVDATPMDCLEMTRPEAIVTVSVYSVPEKEPDPYDTETELEVFVPVLVLE
jgi:hypothetical protein